MIHIILREKTSPGEASVREAADWDLADGRGGSLYGEAFGDNPDATD